MTGFYKLSGAGNDFLALVEPDEEPTPETIRAWCARGVSLGADGLFTLARAHDGGARMIHYNADGGRAELCVNGTRCAARLAFHLGWADEAIVVHTDSGDVGARADGASSVGLEIEPPADEPREMTLDLDDLAVDGWWIRVGVPHFVIDWPEPCTDAPVQRLGPSLRSHPELGPEGANVHWVSYASRHRFAIRSFERGVEAETLACGSGILAAVVVGLAIGRVEPPVDVTPKSGLVLRVERRPATADRQQRWLLTGDARVLAEGKMLGGAHRPTDLP